MTTSPYTGSAPSQESWADSATWVANSSATEPPRQWGIGTARLFRRLEDSWYSYQKTVRALNRGRLFKRVPVVPLPEVRSHLVDWLSQNNRADYLSTLGDVAARLVVTPNTPVKAEQISRVGRLIRTITGQRFVGTSALYQYRPEQLSGYNPDGGPIKFAVIPGAPTPGMDGTPNQQRAMLGVIRHETGCPSMRPPTVLEAATHALGLALENPNGARPGELKQEFRHFDLPGVDEGGYGQLETPVSSYDPSGQFGIETVPTDGPSHTTSRGYGVVALG